MKTNEDMFYHLGKILLLPGILGAIFLQMIGRNGLERLPDCMFRRILGIYCPGCGGTRAAYYLVTGHPVKSFFFHPAVLYVAVVYVIFMGTVFFRRHFSKKQYQPIKIEGYAYVAVVILLLQFIVKNILLLGFHIALLHPSA